MKGIKNKKGISLIVLVITIIVMIILASAIILSLRSSGIIGRANEAKSKSDIANAKNVVSLAYAEWELDEGVIKGTYSSFIDYAKVKLSEAGYTADQIAKLSISDTGAVEVLTYTMYTDSKKDTAPIPDGFTVSSVSTEQTIETGLVIIDEDGNEFVWVPVPDITKFKTTTTYNGTITSSEEYAEPVIEAGGWITDVSLYADEMSQYNDMKASVEEHGGFYIARYEAGLPEGKTTATVKIDGTDKPVSKKGANVWNNIPWDSTWEFDWDNFEVISSITFGDDSQPGAALVAKKAYEASNSVVSHLIYGVEWDAALQFIYNTDADYPTVYDANKGNYTGSLKTTGADNSYAVNNIYDMAGNVYEWSYEVWLYSDSDTRIMRGCDYTSGGAPFERMLGVGLTDTRDNFGFRLTLYIK